MMAGNVFCRSGVESILHLSSVDHFSAFSVSFNRGGRDDAEAGTTCNDNGPGRHTVIIIRVHHHLNQAGRLAGISLHCTAPATSSHCMYVPALRLRSIANTTISVCARRIVRRILRPATPRQTKMTTTPLPGSE